MNTDELKKSLESVARTLRGNAVQLLVGGCRAGELAADLAFNATILESLVKQLQSAEPCCADPSKCLSLGSACMRVKLDACVTQLQQRDSESAKAGDPR